jgi:hypothetical protein
MGGWGGIGRAVGIAAVATLVAAACQGEWRVSNPSPVRAAHVALLPTGKVLLVAGSGNNINDFNAGTFTTSLWDPTTDTFESVATPWDAFCAGHAFLPDGDLLVAGGTTAYPGPSTNNANAGTPKTYVFTARAVRGRPDMAPPWTRRWWARQRAPLQVAGGRSRPTPARYSMAPGRIEGAPAS